MPECVKPHLARGYCGTHYRRLQRHGDASHESRNPPGWSLSFLRDAFEADETDDCFKIPGRGDSYTLVTVDGEPRSAHVVVCEWVHGAKPEWADEVAHSCGHRWCVNRRHVRWATFSEQADDKRGHGTLPIGEATHNAKLTEEDVIEIRSLYAAGGETHRSLADQFDVHRQTIHHVLSGATWKHLLPSQKVADQ